MMKKLTALAFVAALAMPVVSVGYAADDPHIPHVKDAIDTLMKVRTHLLVELKSTDDLKRMVEIGSHIHEIDQAVNVLHAAEHYHAAKKK